MSIIQLKKTLSMTENLVQNPIDGEGSPIDNLDKQENEELKKKERNIS